MEAFLARASWLELIMATSAFFLASTAAGLLMGFGLERALPGRRIWSDPLPAGQLRHEAIGNVIFLMVTVGSFTLLLGSHALRFAEPGWVSGALTVLALNFGFQAYFYLLHRALHHPRLLRFHRWHHVSRVTTPLSGQSTSFGEAFGWMGGYVLLPLLLSWVMPLSAWGFAFYMFYNVTGNIVGHANVEVVPASGGLRYRSLFAGVFTYHALHHLRYTGNYGFASAWMDRALGTEWPDWMTLHARVDAGEPLTLSGAKRIMEGADAALLRTPPAG